MESAPVEPGAYRQTITFDQGKGISLVTGAETKTPNAAAKNAVIYLQKNRQFIQQSVVADPKNAKAWAIAGKIYLLSEDLPSAERFYKKAKALGPLLMDVKDLESLINNKKKEE